MPRHLQDQAPQVVQLPGGGEGWRVGDSVPKALGLNLTAGQRYDQFVRRGRSFNEGLPGTGNAASRVADQEQDGVDGCSSPPSAPPR